MSDSTKHMQQSADSLRKMLETLEPYLPKREFEADPPPKQWERTKDVNQVAAEGSPTETAKVRNVY